MKRLERSERSIYFVAVPLMISVTLLLIWIAPVSIASRLIITAMALMGAAYAGLAYWLRTRKSWRGLRYTTPLVAVSMITVSLILVSDQTPLGFLLYFPVVIISSIRSGRNIGIGAAAFSTLGYSLARWLHPPSPTLFELIFVATNLFIVSTLSGAMADEERMLKHQAQERRVREQAALLRLADALVNAPDLTATFDAALEIAAQILKVDAVSIVVQEGEQYVVQAGWGLMASYSGSRFRMGGSSVAISAIARSQAVAVGDFLRERHVERWLPEREQNLRAALAVPMIREGRAQGAFVIYTLNPRTFSEDEAHLHSLIANQTLLAIERKRAEEAIRRLNEELEQRVLQRTAQLEAVNKELEAFNYSVSHDLRTPLRSIDGFSQAVLEDYADQLDAQGQDFLQRIRAATQRMGQLIDDLLTLSHVTQTELQRDAVDLSGLAQTIAAELQQREPERQVEYVIRPGLVVNGDRRLLRVALENLLDNAWKFTSKYPRAHVEFGAVWQDGKRVNFVRDDGAGFDMTYVDKLFSPFQRLHEMTEFPGNGIGLATVQRIIHRHGGRVWAEGAVEQGATFYFTL